MGTRRDFLKRGAILLGGVALSQISLVNKISAMGLSDIELYVPDIEGQTFSGRLDVHDDLGNFLGYTNFTDSHPKITVTGIKDDNQITLETKVEKAFVGRPALQYTLDSAQNVRVTVYNVELGQEINKINYGMQSAGTHLIELSNLPRANKHYAIVMETDKFTATGVVEMSADGSNLSMGKNSFRVPKRTRIIQAPSNNSFSVTSNNSQQLQGGRMLKANANATNYVFTITNPDAHYMRVFTAPIFGQTNYENRVVGYLPNSLIEPERFRKFMEYCYFKADFNGYNGNPAGLFDNLLVRWIDSNNNGLPEKFVVYKNKILNGQTSTFEQVTIDRVINRFNDKLKLFLNGKNIPFESRETFSNFPYFNNPEINGIAIMADNISEPGLANTYGRLPSTLVSGLIRLRSGGPDYFDLGEPRGTTGVLQELITCIYGPLSPPTDNSIMQPSETIIHDLTTLSDLSVFDNRSLKIVNEPFFKTGEKGDRLMGKY